MYQDIIKRVCLNLSIEADPRHIEGFMRLQYGTLDHLTREEFAKECKLFDKIKEQDDWEANAQSFGLWTLNRVSCSPRNSLSIKGLEGAGGWTLLTRWVSMTYEANPTTAHKKTRIAAGLVIYLILFDLAL